MAKTPSTMLPLGTAAPDFALPATDGRTLTLDDVAGERGTLVMFICNHCPYVVHIREQLAAFGRDYLSQGLGIVAISSNDAEKYPADSFEKMKEEAETVGYPFPYLYDESQAVAKAYRAACTPDLYLFDGERKLVYRGQFDDSRPRSGISPTGKDLRDATDALLARQEIPADQKPSLGCNIKWKPGNAPEYFA